MWQLYDLKRDPFEAQNIFDLQRSPQKLLSILKGDLLEFYFSSGEDLVRLTRINFGQKFSKFLEIGDRNTWKK